MGSSATTSARLSSLTFGVSVALEYPLTSSGSFVSMYSPSASNTIGRFDFIAWYTTSFAVSCIDRSRPIPGPTTSEDSRGIQLREGREATAGGS